MFSVFCVKHCNLLYIITLGYVVTLIEDSLLYSSHAKKASIDVDDVKLAIELQQDKNIACPPSREVIYIFSIYMFRF